MKTQDVLILGALGIGAYVFVIKPLMDAPGKTAEAIAGAPAGFITGTEQFLVGQAQGAASLLGGAGTALSQAVSSPQLQQAASLASILNPITGPIVAAGTVGNAISQGIQNMISTTSPDPTTQAVTPAASLIRPSGFTPINQGGIVQTAQIALRYPTTTVIPFAAPPTRAPYGYSATNRSGQVIATGFRSLAEARAYEIRMGVR
jgi:hypothetical protein